MDDFEYSVAISERDWDCFYQTCQECDMHSPSLAGVDESGMSDIDDTGSILAEKDLKDGQIAGFLGADPLIDGPPDFEGSPVEHRFSKYSVGGMENVLSGSEEDIHLQCVNTFFERLRGLSEAEQLLEPSQVEVRKTREAEICSDGPLASSNTALPENITKLNSPPANSETATGEETTVTVNAKSKSDTMKKDEPDSRIVPELSDSNSDIERNKSASPEIELFIREGHELANEVEEQSQPHESPDVIVCPTPDSDGALNSEVGGCKHLDAANNLESLCNQVMAQDTMDEGKTFLPLPDTDSKSTSKGANPEWSPSALIRKKKRRKKRVSIGTLETSPGYERQLNLSDSDQDPRSWLFAQGRATHPPSSDQTKKIDCTLASVAYSEALRGLALSNPPLNVSSVENKFNILSPPAPLCDSQCQNSRFDLTESSVSTYTLARDGRCRATDLSANSTSTNKLASLPDSTDYSVISTPNDGDDVATILQPCSTVQGQTSMESPALPVSSLAFTACKSGLVIEGRNSDIKTLSTCENEAEHTASLHQSDKMNNSLTSCCESEIYSKSFVAEAVPVTPSNISQNRESNSPPLGASQHGVLTDKVSASKSGLAVEVGNSGSERAAQCQREAKPPQQLEMDCQGKAQHSSVFEKTNFPMSPIVMIGSDMQEELKDRSSYTLSDNPVEAASAYLTVESSNSLPDKSCRPKVPCYSLENNGIHETKYSREFEASSKAVPDNDTISTSQESPGTVDCTRTCNSTFEVNPKLSVSEELLVGPSLVTALSNTNIANMSSENPVSSVTQIHFYGQGGKIPQIPVTDDRKGDASEPRSRDIFEDTSELKYDLESKTEGEVPKSKTENGVGKEPHSKHSVYTMSSFWSEVENLTIKDILSLRMGRDAVPPGFLPPLSEREKMDISDAADSGYFTHLDDTHPHRPSADTSSVADVEDSNPVCDPIVTEDSFNPGVLMWDSGLDPVDLGAGIYPENMTLASVRDLPQPLLSSSSSNSQKHPKKICKNTSVRNLPALGSFSKLWKAHALPTVSAEEGPLEMDYFTEGHVARGDSGMGSLPPPSVTEDISTQSYGFSLTGIFQYIFGGKPSTSSASDVVNTIADCVSGNTVPETYDHFFSDFDAGSFFYPLIKSSDQAKDELVPVFSCSRSASRNLLFPDAYDHFFPSSSSDDEEGEDRGPVRVVTRFTRKTSQTKISTDIYENFFTDSDSEKLNFFWKNMFSLRNVRFTGSASQRQSPNSLSLVPVMQSSRSLRRTIQPVDVLGNPGMPFPDPLLYHLDDRISRQLAVRPFTYGDLQTVVANPRLDAYVLPLQQSDMCLVCIAFASWVLKTANPQAGDAWKAVLLANVSALSAIRYLRRYVREKPQRETTE